MGFENPLACHCFHFLFRDTIGTKPLSFFLEYFLQSLFMRHFISELFTFWLYLNSVTPSLKENHLFRPLDTNVSFRGNLIVCLRKMSLSKSLHVFYNTRPNPKLCVCLFNPVYPATSALTLPNRPDLIFFCWLMHQLWKNLLNLGHCLCKIVFPCSNLRISNRKIRVMMDRIE